MKKYLAVMAVGMASGAIGSYLMQVENKNGKVSKMINKVSDVASNVAQKTK